MRLFPEDDLAIACIYAEARGEPQEGQAAIGEVLLTRTKNKFQSDGTITGTIFWPWAFSWTNTNDRQRTAVFQMDTNDPACIAAAQAWDTAKAGSGYSQNAVMYVNLDLLPKPPLWAKPELFLVKIGRHSFYKAG